MPSSAYFDSCLFIELLQKGNPTRFADCEDLWLKATRHDLWVVTSSIALVEVHKFGKRAGGDEESKAILQFFQHERIAVRLVDRQTAELAHGLARESDIGCMDAIHVATALIAKVQVFYTYDGQKKGRKVYCAPKTGPPKGGCYGIPTGVPVAARHDGGFSALVPVRNEKEGRHRVARFRRGP